MKRGQTLLQIRFDWHSEKERIQRKKEYIQRKKGHIQRKKDHVQRKKGHIQRTIYGFHLAYRQRTPSSRRSLPSFRMPSPPSSVRVESYRGLLFKQLWLGCAALEKPGLAATSRECLVARRTTLGVLLRKGEDSWSVDVFVAHALRSAVALQERGSGDEDASARDSAELSAFCLEGLCGREGEGWPAEVEGGREGAERLHPSWVDWLQYSAGLHQKVGHAGEAQRLLRLAYEYVHRCRRRQQAEAGRGGSKAAECAAYAGILKMHTAAMITSIHPPGGAPGDAVATPLKKTTKKRTEKRAAEPPKPSSAALALTSRGLDYLGDVVAALEGLVENEDGELAGTAGETASFVGAAVKAWTRAKKSCAVTALWAEEEGAGEGEGGEAKSPGELEGREWAALNVRGRLVLADLSLKLALVRNRGALGRALDRVPPAVSLFQLAVESYIRVAHAHLGVLAGVAKADPAAGVSNGRRKSTAATKTNAGEGARQALAAAEGVLEMAGDVFPSQVSKRVGTGWFGLGTSLLDRGESDAGLDATVRGCRLLESWVEAEVECSRAEVGVVDNGDLSGAGVTEVLGSVQLDTRLAKLSLALQDSAVSAMAAAAAARALAFCPGMWCFSSEGQPEAPSSALALVERFVACKLGRGDSTSHNPAVATGGLTSATIETVSAYLSDGEGVRASVAAKGKRGTCGGDDLPATLEKRGLPPVAIVWVLLAACRVYRAQLPRCVSEAAAAGEEEGQGGALWACVEGHRLATKAVLGVCASCTRGDGEDDNPGGERHNADVWEAHARLLAAKFEHDLHLVDVSDVLATGNATAGVRADLPGGIQHAASGAAAASRLGGEYPPPGSPVAAAAAAGGVFACLRAMLVRAVAESDDDVKDAMRQGLDLFHQAARDPEWTPHHGNSPRSTGPAGAGSIVDSLGLLEAHFTLHGDTLRRARAAEVRLVLADRVSVHGETATASLPQGEASSAAALGCIGSAFQAGGLPGLGSMYGSAASEEVSRLAAPAAGGAGAAADERGNSSSPYARAEAARIAVDILRGVCLAEQSGGEQEGESVLLEARRAVSRLGSKASLVAPVTVAYLECVAGLGLSWVYQRSGRLLEAMGEVRQVMRLCRSWASAGGPLAVSDKQTVTLSAEKGRCVHDEGWDGLAAAAAAAGEGQDQAEEGVGAEGGEVEDVIGDGDGREKTVFALGSRWIPVYLEGLARMGRLWRERGIASKASLTLRQGSVMSESLHAARFLRHCLKEEVEVAAGKHQFARAERLLRACQDLLRQERRELTSAAGDASSAECAACQTCDPARSALGAPAAPAAKGKAQKRGGAKKPGGKKRSPGAASATVEEGCPGGAVCPRCRELAVNTAELAAVEASLLRKQGGFDGALAACERGQAVLNPLVEAAGEPVSWSGSLSFPRVSVSSEGHRNGRGNGHRCFEGPQAGSLGWRAAEVLAALRLQQGRACCLLGKTAAGEELLQECSDAAGAPALVRATALYRMGRVSLDAGDAAGARLPLERAEALTRGAGAPKLVRKVRRALAVALAELAVRRGKSSSCSSSPGGDGVGVDGSWRAAALSSLSVGVTQCNQVTHASARRARKGEVEGDPGGVASNPSGATAGMRLFDVVSGSRGGSVDGSIQRGGECSMPCLVFLSLLPLPRLWCDELCLRESNA